MSYAKCAKTYLGLAGVLLFMLTVILSPAAALAASRVSQTIPLSWTIDEESWVMVTADISSITDDVENIEWTTKTIKSGGRESSLFSDGPDPYIEFRSQKEGETIVSVRVVTETSVQEGEIAIVWGADVNDVCRISESAPANLKLNTDNANIGYVVHIPLEVMQTQPVTAHMLRGWLEVPEGAKVELRDHDGQLLDAEQHLATGHHLTVQLADGTAVLEGNIVLAGDLLGIGTINITQLVRMARVYSGQETLSEPYASAASLSGTGRVTLSDLVGEANAYRAASV